MNTREVQQALKDIGWPITVDGSFGSQTHEAVKEFQNGWAPWDLLVDGMAGPQTHNALRASLAYGGACGAGFYFREFASKGNGWIKIQREHVRALEVYRQRYGPVTILSGYRDPVHNRAVGGKPNSQHLYGNANDIGNPKASLSAVRNLKVFSGIGIKKSTGLVLHVDSRHLGPNTTGGTPSSPTVWFYA